MPGPTGISRGCPIELRAEQAPLGDTLEVNRPAPKGVSQGLRLVVMGLNPDRIAAATVTRAGILRQEPDTANPVLGFRAIRRISNSASRFPVRRREYRLRVSPGRRSHFHSGHRPEIDHLRGRVYLEDRGRQCLPHRSRSNHVNRKPVNRLGCNIAEVLLWRSDSRPR